MIEKLTKEMAEAVKMLSVYCTAHHNIETDECVNCPFDFSVSDWGDCDFFCAIEEPWQWSDISHLPTDEE